MPYIIALVLLVTMVALWWLYASPSTQYPADLATSRSAKKSYRCVEVCSGHAACKAARNLEHVRFLYQEAPSLPLTGCTEQQCTCGFAYHDDRRENASRKPDALWEAHPYATARRTEYSQSTMQRVQRWSYPGIGKMSDRHFTTRS
jgi:hypothetical protein